jgi:cobalt-zinc-cadmium efflux system outer membrane protein
MKFLFILISFILLFGLNYSVIAQTDTVLVTVGDVIQQLDDKNLDLNALKKGIEYYEGLKRQAGIFANPELSFEYNLFNPTTKRWMSTSSETQYALQVMQLFETAGKRSKRIKSAQFALNSKKLEYELLKNEYIRLVKELLNRQYYNLLKLDIYDNGIESLTETVESMDRMYDMGNISLSELLRIKSLLFKLVDERKEISNELNEYQRHIKFMISDEQNQFLKPSSASMNSQSIAQIDIDESVILERIDKFSPIVQYYASTLNISASELELQRAKAYPDLKLGIAFDKYGSIGENYAAVQLEMDLPFFDRNQGIIDAQRAAAEADRIAFESLKRQIASETSSIIAKFSNTRNAFGTLSGFLSGNTQELLSNIIDNYRKRNISAVEFTDLYETFNDNIIQLLNLEMEMLNYIEMINFQTDNYFN